MKYENFKVLGNDELGRIFFPDGLSYDQVQAIHISPLHGRAVALKIADYQWITIKGGGWNYGGPQVYISNKDEKLILGLYPLESAKRELAVSKEIEKISNQFPKVLSYKEICKFSLPEKYHCLKTAQFKSGELINPCLLYTQVKCPFRVADCIYLTEAEKTKVIESCCKYWQVPTTKYVDTFISHLASNIAILHKNKFINDSLDYGNVTMLAEIIDYEWVTAPMIKLLDDTYGLELTEERKEKEILYGAEICLQLKAILHEEYNLFDIYRKFINAYRKINPQFITGNQNIQKILKKEEIIL